MAAVVVNTGSRDGACVKGAIIAGQAWVQVLCIDKAAFSV
jgi:hypothetical protein